VTFDSVRTAFLFIKHVGLVGWVVSVHGKLLSSLVLLILLKGRPQTPLDEQDHAIQRA
jgi:hypothetical protein